MASVAVVKALQLHRAIQELMNSFNQRDGARYLNAIHLALEIGLCNEDIPCVFQVSRRVPIDVPNVEDDDKKSKLDSEQLNREDKCIQYVLEPFPCQRPMIRKSMGLAVQHEVVIEETGGKDGKRLVIRCLALSFHSLTVVCCQGEDGLLFLELMRTNPNVTIFRPIEALHAVFERQSNPVELPGSYSPDRANTTYECHIKLLPGFVKAEFERSLGKRDGTRYLNALHLASFPVSSRSLAECRLMFRMWRMMTKNQSLTPSS